MQGWRHRIKQPGIHLVDAVLQGQFLVQVSHHQLQPLVCLLTVHIPFGDQYAVAVIVENLGCAIILLQQLVRGQQLPYLLLLPVLELVILQCNKLKGIPDLDGKTKMILTSVNDQPALLVLQGSGRLW